MVRKQPMAAWEDSEFATEAHELTGTTFIAHVRYATTGGLDVVNTHPFLQDGRLFAHNGVVEGLDALDARLHDLGTADLVAGQSDSERVFALITGYARARGGDVEAGLRDAVEWLADNVPIFALNVLLCTATDFWALRYPEPHELYLLDRRRPAEHRRFELRTNRIHTRRDSLRRRRRWSSPPSEWTTTRPGVRSRRASWCTSTPTCASTGKSCYPTRRSISSPSPT